MYTLGAEIVPIHDYPLEDSLRVARGHGPHPRQPLDLGRAARPSRQPRRRHRGDQGGSSAKYGITPTGLTMYGKTQEEMRQRIEMAAELDIPYVVFDCEEHYPNFVSRLPAAAPAKPASETGVKIAVENHLTVPFTADFESGGHEAERWDEGVDTLAQIKRLVTDIDSHYLGVCVAPPHLWVISETIADVVCS